MTTAEAKSLMWDTAAQSLGFLGLVAGLLLGLALIGLAARW